MDSGVKPLGICYHLGIKIHFALPGNAQAKIAERTFASLSRVIDDRPEFKSAHAGHNPGAAPDSRVEPVPFEAVQSIIRREVERNNREAGRRSQGAKGRSYQDVFKASLAERVIRRPAARQLYLAGLIYKPVSVNRHGQIVADTWIYGSPSTQANLLPFHGTGKQILLGRDPDDLSAPAIAFDEDGRLICEGIEYVERGRYDSVQGIRTAASNRKAARDTVARAEQANNYLTDSELASALAALDLPKRAAKPDPDKMGSVPAEFLRNMDTLLAEKRAKGEKLA